MYITIDDNKFITTVSWGGRLENGIEVKDFEFTEDIRAYRYIGNNIILDQDKLQQLQNEQSIQEEIQELQDFLSNTDYIALQWLEEDEFDLSHHRPRAAYKETMQKRQAVRAQIRKLTTEEAGE